MKKILIADDDRILVTSLATYLNDHGFDPIVTFDAMHATMVLGYEDLSAAILDINMPGGTGLEVLRRLKSNLRLEKVPVIVLTSTEDPATHAKALRLGAAMVLRKPYCNGELLKTLLELIQKAERKKTVTITLPVKKTDFNVKYDKYRKA
jgi:DNA-binding response OmpR family regulator